MLRKAKLYKFLTIIACTLSLLFILGITIRPLSDHGVWTDLTIGKEILNSKSIPHEDIFSFASSGQKWVDENWLYQVILYWLYSFVGISGLILIKGLLLTGISLLYIRMSYKRLWNPAITAVILAAMFYLFREKWLLRAQTVGIVLFFLEMAILRQYQSLRKKRYLWCFPPLFLLWVNIHVSFFIGLLTLIVFWIAEFFKKYMRKQHLQWFGRSLLWTQIIGMFFIIVLCAIATLFNPYGKEIYSYALQSPSVTMLYCVMNWLSFERVFMLNIPLLILPAFTFLSMFFVPTRKSDITDGVLLVVLFPVCYFLKRFTIFPFILTLPLSLKYIGAMINMILYELKFNKTAIRIASSLIYGSICIAGVLFFGIKYISAGQLHNFMNPNANLDFYPQHAIEYMKEHEVKPNIYTPFFYGGYLLYNMYPEYKHFIDYRTLFIGGMPLLDDLKIRQAEIGWEFIVDKYHINTMLLRYNPGERYLLRERDQFHEKVVHSPDWRLAYFDDHNLLYVRSHYEIYNYDKDRFFLYYDPEDIWSVATADELHTEMIKSDLTRRISMDPPCAWAYVALGVISIKEGDDDKAADYFEKAASIRHDNKKIALYKSLWDQRLESSPPVAITSSKNPKQQYDEKLQEAFTLMVLGRFEDAKSFLETIATEDPSTYQAYVYLTLCQQKLGNYEDALYACQKAMLMKPNDTMVGYYLSRCYLQFEIYDQAVKKIKDAIQFDQNNYLYWYTLAEAYYHRGNYDDSMRMCRKAVKLRPHFVEPWVLAGDLYRHLNMYDNSLEVLSKAMILEPFSDRIYLSLAITYIAKEDYDNAIDNLKHITSPLFGKDPLYLFTSAQIAAWQGNNDRALDLLAKAIDIGGDDYKTKAKTTHEFNSLLSEPRFIELTK